MSDISPRLLTLAGTVADGQPVDWEDVTAGISADERRLLEGLRLLERVADAHAGASADAVTSSTSGTGRRGDEQPFETFPTTWGPLEILEFLGAGSSGRVYRGRDPRLDREVAIKIIRHEIIRPEAGPRALTSTTAIVEEARLLARVRHPGVATVYGAEVVDGRVGLWMELIRGRTLETEIRERGSLPFGEIQRIGVLLAEALAAVHHAGLIHRDVKAQNVMREASGRIVLTDFGTGLLSEGEAGAASLAGTPLYLAPEVIDGGPPTYRSDVYSLGVLLYRLATGTFPVTGRTLREVRRAHARGDRRFLTASASRRARRLTRIIDRALATDPASRFADASVIAGALRALDRRISPLWAGSVAAAGIASVGLVAPLFDQTPREGPPSSGIRLDVVDAAIQARTPIKGPFFGDLVPCTDRKSGALAICNVRTGQIDTVRDADKDGYLLGQPPPRALLAPDGGRLAYLWTYQGTGPDDARDALFVFDLKTRSHHELHRSAATTPGGRAMELSRWMPDGSAIVVRDGRGTDGRYLRVPLDGGAPIMLLALTQDDDRRGDLSPDGETMLVTRVTPSGSRDLHAIDVRSGAVRWQGPTAGDDAEGRWTPDGSGFVFVTDVTGCESLAWLPWNGSQSAGAPRHLRELGRAATTLFGFGPDGTLLIQQNAQAYRTAYVADVDLAQHRVSRVRMLRPGRCESSTGADWNPRDDRVAYVAGRPNPGARSRLIVEDVDGLSSRSLVLEDPFVEFAHASWSPDGRALAVLYRTGIPLSGDPVQVVMLADLEAQRPTTLLRAPATEQKWRDLAWAPDGTGLYFRSGDDIVRVDQNGQSTMPFTPPGGEDSAAGLAVSSSGLLAIGLEPKIPGKTSVRACVLHVVRPNGHSAYRRQLPGFCQSMVWTPDGRQVLVGTAPRQGESQLWLIDPAADSVNELMVEAPEPNFLHLSIDRDGRRLLITAGRPGQSRTMVNVSGIR